MSTLVSFDPKGVFGPGVNLIYNSSYYNEQGVFDLATLMEANFEKLTKIKPAGKKEFCAFVLERNKSTFVLTPTDIISTQFFQNMQRAEQSPFHDKVLGFIVPRMLNAVHEQFPQVGQAETEIKEWAARLAESYMSDEQIQQHCKL